eukprot:TRINITY_DN106601_c0_g1_i1.p1 TRINITY_DN106601_c0_g1~~TRINITY_DN106601_c0_g1_i1.p1  ORF type:complete len:405 (-),score=33.15 TRINITY_DN106601_c0_g1_i1:81-1169(-)
MALFRSLEIALSIVFGLEVVVKLAALGCKEYFLGADRYFHWFDVFLVCASLAEGIASEARESIDIQADNSIMKLLKMLRLGKILRGMKFIPYVGALKSIVLGIASTLGLLLWSGALLCSVILFFALVINQLVVDHCRLESQARTQDPRALPDCQDPILMTYWSSVSESFLSLFMMLFGGVGFDVTGESLREVSWVALFAFIVFKVITDLAVLNVFTGVFCEAAITNAARSRESMQKAFLSDRKFIMHHVKGIFKELTQGTSAKITIEQFEQGLKHVELQSCLEALSITTDDAYRVFSLLDADSDGLLDLEEFVDGCLHLRGAARAVHIATLVQEGQSRDRKLQHLHDMVSAMSQRFEGGHAG